MANLLINERFDCSINDKMNPSVIHHFGMAKLAYSQYMQFFVNRVFLSYCLPEDSNHPLFDPETTGGKRISAQHNT